MKTSVLIAGGVGLGLFVYFQLGSERLSSLLTGGPKPANSITEFRELNSEERLRQHALLKPILDLYDEGDLIGRPGSLLTHLLPLADSIEHQRRLTIYNFGDMDDEECVGHFRVTISRTRAGASLDEESVIEAGYPLCMP